MGVWTANTRSLRSPRLTIQDIMTYHRTMYIPAMRYALPAIATNEEELDKVQAGALAVFLQRLGLSSKTPKATLDELEKALMTAAKNPRLVAAIEKLEFDSDVTSAAELARHLKADFDRWGPVVKATGYKAED